MTVQKLTDILHDSISDGLRDAWDTTDAAPGYGVLPAGTYTCRVEAGELFKSSGKGTPGYKLRLRVLHGDHAGRIVWHDVWLTVNAMPIAKRDLAKLGVTTLAQLEQPLPPRMRAEVQLVVRRDDNGIERNRVRSFEIIGIDPPDTDPFAPTDDTVTTEDVTPDDSHPY
jgi:hypothetical protein